MKNRYLIIRLSKSIKMLIKNFFLHEVGKNSAALAYYLVFALFPFLIFINNLLGLINLDIVSITKILNLIFPADIVNLIETYLNYISKTSSPSLFWFSLIFSIYFPMRVAKGIMDNVRKAYELSKPPRPFLYAFRHFISTLVLFTALSLTFVVLFMGEPIIRYITKLFPIKTYVHVSDFLIILWHYLRFFLLAAIMFISLGTLYGMAQDNRQPASYIFPGAILSVVGWLAISIGFSFYVENFASYSIIYGTLGTVIVLLIWLYLTAVILILGAEMNVVIRKVWGRGAKKKITKK